MSLVRWDPFGESSTSRWDPFRELNEFGDRLNQMLRGTYRGEGREALAVPEWSPAVDILETPTEYQVKAELPEMKREDVKINVQNGQLRIEGERKQEKEEKGKRHHRVERYYGSFLRTFTMPTDVDETKIKAEMKEGVLMVHLPKSDAAKQKAIEVKIS